MSGSSVSSSMASENVKNIRLACPYCKDTFLIKSYSNHLLNNHKEEIFIVKANKEALHKLCTRKNEFFRPIDIKVQDKTLYYVPCCKKFYSKDTLANKHSSKKECREVVLQNANELYNSLSPSNIINTHNGTGDIINNITQNITIVDMSGNITKTITNLVKLIDGKEARKRLEIKKKLKLKMLLEKHNIDYDTEVSEMESVYESDFSDIEDEYSRIKVPKYDLSKDMNKERYKAFIKLGIDLSREGLKLRSKEEHDFDYQEKKELKIQDLETQIDTLDYEIDEYKTNIRDYEERLEDAHDESTKYNIEKRITRSKASLDKCKRDKRKLEEELQSLKKK